jgi:hypothetical protein
MRAAVLLALLATPGSTAAPPIDAVTVIVASEKAGCSGVAVSVVPGKTYVLTAKHCSNWGNPEAVTFSNGTTLFVDRIVTSANYDLELLRLQTKYTYPTAYIGFAHAPLTNFMFHGRSAEQDWAYALGVISGPPQVVRYSKKWLQRVIPLECLGCAEGGSGGGIFSDGKLIGIFVAGREDNSMSYMIPSSSVVKFLRAAAKEESK